MKKWICKNEHCGKNCELSIDYQPIQCPRGLVWVAKWQEMGETVAESKPRPKLTAEVFDRITASPEVLAEKFVIPSFVSDEGYMSVLIPAIFRTKEKAIAATVAKLKEEEGCVY